jgi:arginase
MTRRVFLGASAAAAAALASRLDSPFQVDLISAPSNLGLKAPAPGVEPGAWKAPEALLEAGLGRGLAVRHRVRLARPSYRFEGEPGSRIRNGPGIRAFTESLASIVEPSLRSGGFPFIVGGDCSVLLGGLLGLRRAGGRGLVHVDGHSDFFHSGNYDTATRLGSAAGMDLALATGRGEEILTRWPGVSGPLVEDADAIQVGERDSKDPTFATTYGDIVRTDITRLIVQDVLRNGVLMSADRVVARLAERGLDRAWLHVDLDVLDQSVLPAVDSPGSPGLTFEQLATLLRVLRMSGRIAGAEIAIYDPTLDPTGRYARDIVACVSEAFGPERR